MEERRSSRRRVEDYQFDELINKIEAIQVNTAKSNLLIELILSNIKIFITAATIAVSSILGLLNYFK